MKVKKWNTFVIGGTVLTLTVLAGITALIDPFLHYHKQHKKYCLLEVNQNLNTV